MLEQGLLRYERAPTSKAICWRCERPIAAGLYWFEKLSPREWFCDACFTGDYPDELRDCPEMKKAAKEGKLNI